MAQQITTADQGVSSSMILDKFLLKLTLLLGWTSLLLFLVFMYNGSLNMVKLGLTDRVSLILNACLSLVFFIQHSGMIRHSFQQWTARFMDEKYNGALFTIVSSVALLAVVLLWQESSYTLGSAQGAFRWVLRVAFVTSFVGFNWGIRCLGSFDTFGVRSIRRSLRGHNTKPPVFMVAGPYRWVRHPLYLFVIIMIWSSPNLTLDRLLFNVLWTAWIVIGAVLEERDLVDQFGDDYRSYQKDVPMLIPMSIRPIR